MIGTGKQALERLHKFVYGEFLTEEQIWTDGKRELLVCFVDHRRGMVDVVNMNNNRESTIRIQRFDGKSLKKTRESPHVSAG